MIKHTQKKYKGFPEFGVFVGIQSKYLKDDVWETVILNLNKKINVQSLVSQLFGQIKAMAREFTSWSFDNDKTR